MAKKPNKETPKKKPVKIFVSYRELVNEYPNWGQEMERKKNATEMRNHPTHDELMLAFLTKIVDLLREIRNEVKKERVIK